MHTLLMNTSLPDLTRDSEGLYLRILAKVPALSVLMESAEWLDFMPPDLGQMRTYTDRPHCRLHPERTCINEKLKLPDSVLHAIRDKATSIFAALPEDDEKLPNKKELLIRLASDPAWLELYKHNESIILYHRLCAYSATDSRCGATTDSWIDCRDSRRGNSGIYISTIKTNTLALARGASGSCSTTGSRGSVSFSSRLS
jgi:hypothetical protein